MSAAPRIVACAAIVMTLAGGVAPAVAAAATPTFPTAAVTAPATTTGWVTVTAEQNLATGAVPVSGAVFELRPVVGVDLTTQAGVDAAKAYMAAPASVAGKLGDPIKLDATGTDGVASLSGVPMGLYQLHQLSGSVQYTDMLITVPAVNDQGVPQWRLNVFPKPVPPTTPPPTTPPPTTPPTTPPPTTPPNGGDGDTGQDGGNGDTGVETQGQRINPADAALMGIIVAGGGAGLGYAYRRNRKTNAAE